MCCMTETNPNETRPSIIGGETIPTRVSTETSPLIEGDTIAVKVPEASASADTLPVKLPSEPGQIFGNRKAWFWLILLSLLALLLIAGAGAWGGYRSGLEQRTRLEATLVAGYVKEQYDLGVRDMEAGRYEIARQRFEYVINNSPAYPGVIEKYSAVLLALNTTATPTLVPTPTLTPTPDLRGVEELFAQAQAQMAGQDWSGAIETLLRLRQKDSTYQIVKVDSMLYVALRNRGVQKILNLADLEGGTYDLALAERFGLLDVEANNYRLWADLYVTGLSFWGLDWQQSAYYFGQLLLVAPNLRDLSGITATERFITATIKYGDSLAQNKEWCKAQEQYKIALNYSPNEAIKPTATEAASKCEGKSENGGEGKPGAQPTATPTLTDTLLVTETPTLEATQPPTDTPMPQPTETPTPPPPEPTSTPTDAPTEEPTEEPTATPTP